MAEACHRIKLSATRAIWMFPKECVTKKPAAQWQPVRVDAWYMNLFHFGGSLRVFASDFKYFHSSACFTAAFHIRFPPYAEKFFPVDGSVLHQFPVNKPFGGWNNPVIIVSKVQNVVMPPGLFIVIVTDSAIREIIFCPRKNDPFVLIPHSCPDWQDFVLPADIVDPICNSLYTAVLKFFFFPISSVISL